MKKGQDAIEIVLSSLPTEEFALQQDIVQPSQEEEEPGPFLSDETVQPGVSSGEEEPAGFGGGFDLFYSQEEEEFPSPPPKRTRIQEPAEETTEEIQAGPSKAPQIIERTFL